MISEDITFTQSPQSNIVLSIPARNAIHDHAQSFRIIHKGAREYENKEWLDHATDLARNEMISDVDEILVEVKKELKKARKQMGWRRYLNPFRAIWQLM